MLSRPVHAQFFLFHAERKCHDTRRPMPHEVRDGQASASNIGNVTENITISLDGKDLQIAFNARYLSDCMHTINDEFIKINFTSQIAPCTICSAEDDKYLYLILPVRIVE